MAGSILLLISQPGAGHELKGNGGVEDGRSNLAMRQRPYRQNNYRTLGASDVRRVAASPLPFFMKNRLIVFERAAAANAQLSNRSRQ
jgi:hypothetical protein